MNLYKEVTKNNWTFPSQSGDLTVSQLWQLPLEHSKRASLETVAIGIYKELQEKTQGSFLSKKRPTGVKTLQYKLELVRDIIDTRELEVSERKQAEVNRTHNQLIDKLIAEKQIEELGAKSISDLQALKR